MELSSAVDFARVNRHSVLITIRRDGRPQLSNVLHHVFDDGVIRISITADRAKYKNLLREPWAALHVTQADFYAYAVLEGSVELTPVATRTDDATVDELVAYYRAAMGEHDDWNAYRQAMVADRRVIVEVHADPRVRDALSDGQSTGARARLRLVGIGRDGVGRERVGGDERRLVALGVTEHLRHRLQQLPADRSVGVHQRAELPEGESVADEVARGRDRRQALAFVDQGDLTEVVAPLQGRSLGAADRDRRLAGVDQEEGGTARALADDGLSLREPAHLEQARDLLDLGAVELGEERHALERLDGVARHRLGLGVASRVTLPAVTARHCSR